MRTGVYFKSVSRIGELGYGSTVQDYHLGILVEQIHALNTIQRVGRSVSTSLDGLVTVCLAVWFARRFFFYFLVSFAGSEMSLQFAS